MNRSKQGGCGTTVFAVVWLLFSLVFFGVAGYITLNEAREYKALQDNGLVISATVTDKDTEYDDGTTYWVWYTFETQDANGETRTYGDKQSVKSAIYEHLEKGGRVAVIYSASDPTLSSIQDDISKPPWFLPAFSAIFVIVGLGILFSVLKQRQIESDAPSSEAPASYYVDTASINMDDLRCEQCGLPLGPDMLNCMHRDSEACAYTLNEGKLPYGGCLGPFLIPFGLFFAGMPGGFTLSSTFSGNFQIFDLVGLLFILPFIAAGLGLVGLGLFVLLGKHTTLHNEKTGQRWQSSRFLGRTIYEIRASGLQDVSLSSVGSSNFSYPVSCAALVKSEDATGIIYNTILSLMARKAILMRQQYTQSQLFFKRKPIAKWSFAFTTTSGASMQDGTLEQALTGAIREPQMTPVQIPQALRFLMGASSQEHGANIREMLRSIAGQATHHSPDHWLRTEMVGPDAESRGLGSLNSAMLRSITFEPSQDADMIVDTISRQISQLRTDFERHYPEAAEDLWQAIEAGLKALEPSD